MDDAIEEDVKKYGWSSINIFDHTPPFLYTAGLMHTFAHPELIVFGLESDNARALFSGLVSGIRTGRSFAEPGVHTLTIGGDEHQVGFRKVHPTQHEMHLGYAMGFLTNIGRIGELKAVQAFWPDKAGKFPFDVGCDLDVYELQPRLDIAVPPQELKRFRRQYE